ncbi:efflux RND transporter periplasmic adaptor subunit [Robbsia sp. KACC 23696]|uniref:efflux RND transporter periplasmic adaptor subunit n=1 Tax=Robbsia sp. KACC 23696 TaxID=3149231 RepID=UPI00325B5F2A
MNKAAVSLRAALLAVLGLLSLSGCRSERVPESGASTAVDSAGPVAQHDGAGEAVSVIRLEPQVLPISMTLPGRVLAYETSEVRPQVGGIVTRRSFVEGALVQAGQPLYQIDSSRYELAYAQATAALAGARAAVPLARATLARERTLLASGATSRQAHDQAVAELARAEAGLNEAQAVQRRASLDRDYAVVRAPIGGYIDRSSVSAGALVVADQAEPLTRIHRIDRVYVDLRQSADQLRDMRRMVERAGAMPSGKASKVTLTLSKGETYATVGRLDLTESRIAPDTDTVALRAVFENPDRTLLPGMYVQANVVAGNLRDAFLLPQRAVTRDARGAAVVWIVVHGKAVQRVLSDVQPYGNNWLVNGGMAAGTLLIVEGEMHIREGQAIKTEEVHIDTASGLVTGRANSAASSSTAAKGHP